MFTRARRRVSMLAAAGLLPATVLTGGGPAPTALAQAVAVTGNLPGGTSIEVTINTPPEGASFAQGPVTVAGTASVGTGVPVADTALIYVLDVSGSTAERCSDEPDDPRTILRCEVTAINALNKRAVALGTIGQAGAVVFGSTAKTVDVQYATGAQLITNVGTDDDNDLDHLPDIEQAMSTAFSNAPDPMLGNVGGVEKFQPRSVQGGTNFADAITAAAEVARASTNRHKMVIFLSDGKSNTGASVDGPLGALPADVAIFTFAVGHDAGCELDPEGLGSLGHIAARARGACKKVDNPANLPAELPTVIASELTSLSLRVDDAAPVPITGVTPALPGRGPVEVDFLARTPLLAPGAHTVCVTATGSDGGGAGELTSCHPITVNLDAPAPGGTSIAVTIDSPADGAALLAGPAQVSGTASIGPGRDLADAALIYVLDVSGSTDFPEVPGCGGDQNGDERSDRVLDCEIAAARALNDRAVAEGSLTDVGVAVFGSTAAPADVKRVEGQQFITGPGAVGDESGVRDIDRVLTSAFSNETGTGGLTAFTPREVDGGTNFADGIAKAMTVAGASGKARRIVAFLSDGEATEGGSIAVPLRDVPDNVDFFTFAVGGGASCANPGANAEGSLQDIAVATGGICTAVPDVAALPAVVPGVITATLAMLALQVDGLTPVPVTDVTPTLPQDGPVQVSYRASTADLAVGPHTLCMTATGRESGAAVSVTVCHAVTVKQPVLVLDPPIGPPGFVTLAVGTDFPPGGVVRLEWSLGISETPGEVTVGPDGRFEAQVLVFHGDPLGLRELTATAVRGPQFPAVTSPPFLVVARALQPPSFQDRR